MGEIDGTFTEHIEVAPPASAEAILTEPIRATLTPAQQTLDFNFAVRAPQASVALSIAPPNGGISIGTDATELATTGQIAARGSEGLFADLDGMLVEVGDLVFIRYDDQPERPLSVRLSNTTNNPNEGVVHVKQPLGVALLGASLDEQVTVRIGDRTRIAIIEKIEKSRDALLAAE